jgi:hypothetical protein
MVGTCTSCARAAIGAVHARRGRHHRRHRFVYLLGGAIAALKRVARGSVALVRGHAPDRRRSIGLAVLSPSIAPTTRYCTGLAARIIVARESEVPARVRQRWWAPDARLLCRTVNPASRVALMSLVRSSRQAVAVLTLASRSERELHRSASSDPRPEAARAHTRAVAAAAGIAARFLASAFGLQLALDVAVPHGLEASTLSPAREP